MTMLLAAPLSGMIVEDQPSSRPSDNGSRALRKRKRVVVSCTECHRRKQKCDRLLPCSNCCVRNKQPACRYETESPPSNASIRNADIDGELTEDATSPNNGRQSSVIQVPEDRLSSSDSTSRVTALGYSKSSNHNALGILKKLQSVDSDHFEVDTKIAPTMAGQAGLREKYKSLIRQLPARPYLDQLVEIFFRDVNRMYLALDSDLFYDHMRQWHSLSFSELNKGPRDLPTNQRYFPAMLFQVLAQALQFLPLDHDQSLESLKYAAGMSFDEVAADYSESGAAILALLGKRDISLVAVQAGFLRTSYLKCSGQVTESWHSLGQTIRDAQEMGLDKETSEEHTAKEPEKAIEWLWCVELRRRLWVLLQIWDVHMSVQLGRPTSLRYPECENTMPIDARPPRDKRTSLPTPRSDSDPPTPLTSLIWNYKFILPLWGIMSIAKEGSHPRDSTKFDSISAGIEQLVEQLPPYFQLEHPDTTFDSRPDCHWLKGTRHAFKSLVAFLTLSLHKPYVFTIRESRNKALRAALDVLDAQRQIFKLYEASHYRMFNLVLSTFDAIVLTAAVYVLYPHEHSEYVSTSLQHLQWSIERFQTMSSRNSMARSALSVLQAIQIRLKKALGGRKDVCTYKEDSPTVVSSAALPNLNISESSSSTPTTSVEFDQTMQVGTDPKAPIQRSMFEVPLDFNFNEIPPLQPTHDLLFNDLSGMSTVSQSESFQSTQQLFDPNSDWQFGGAFQDDSFWNLMNQYGR